MKKIIILLISIFLYGNSSYEIASKIVNDSSKNEKLKLLFPDGSYMTNGKPDVKAITQVLKMNSLLQYSYENARNINIRFNANAKAGVFLKVITSAFEQIGVNYYLVSEYTKDNEKMSVAFNINSKYIIDPGALYDAFRKMNVYIKDASKKGSDFTYELDFSRVRVFTDYTLNSGGLLELTKPLDPYFIKVNNISKLDINIGLNSIWYPKVEFLDKNLNLIQTYKNEQNTKQINIQVPKFCEYIIVDDIYTLENIKLGLNIKGY